MNKKAVVVSSRALKSHLLMLLTEHSIAVDETVLSNYLRDWNEQKKLEQETIDLEARYGDLDRHFTSCEECWDLRDWFTKSKDEEERGKQLTAKGG